MNEKKREKKGLTDIRFMVGCKIEYKTEYYGTE